MPLRQKIRWSEPWRLSRARAPAMMREMRSLLFNRRMALCAVLGLLVSFDLFIILTFSVGQPLIPVLLSVPWWRLLGMLAFVGLFFPSVVYIQAMMPSYVTVRRDFVQFNQGNEGVRVLSKDIERVEILPELNGYQRMKVEYRNRKGGPRTREKYIASSVDMPSLIALVDALNGAARQHSPAGRAPSAGQPARASAADTPTR